MELRDEVSTIFLHTIACTGINHSSQALCAQQQLSVQQGLQRRARSKQQPKWTAPLTVDAVPTPHTPCSFFTFLCGLILDSFHDVVEAELEKGMSPLLMPQT